MIISAGDPWTFTTRTGAQRRYKVASDIVDPQPASVVTLTCLDPPFPPVEGYRGGEKRQAMLYLRTLLDPSGGWTQGCADERMAA